MLAQKQRSSFVIVAREWLQCSMCLDSSWGKFTAPSPSSFFSCSWGCCERDVSQTARAGQEEEEKEREEVVWTPGNNSKLEKAGCLDGGNRLTAPWFRLVSGLVSPCSVKSRYSLPKPGSCLQQK